MKEVHCEHCSTIYHYLYRVVDTRAAVAFPEGLTRNAAEHAARSFARRGVAPAACPGCGRIQANMVPALRRQFRRRCEARGIIIPAAILLVCIATALLTTNFFDEPLRGNSAIAVAITALAALVPFLLFAVRPWMISHAFNVNHFGPAHVPIGTKGPVPAAQTAPSD
jgi:hypothetical protein